MSEGPIQPPRRGQQPLPAAPAHNPVDWYPWGEEALERARAEDKPIFLSVGYSTCYWCHVMERESFSDPAIAELMNRDFVNIKVDREERPDLDEIYMAATQVMTQPRRLAQLALPDPGPAAVLRRHLLPARGPPRACRGFPTVLGLAGRGLEGAARATSTPRRRSWARRCGACSRTAPARQARPAELPGPEALDRSLLDLERSFDDAWGGFGAAPKFPTPANLFLLLELADDRPAGAPGCSRRRSTGWPAAASTTSSAAASTATPPTASGRSPTSRRCSTTTACCSRSTPASARRSADPEAERVIRETAGFLERELTAPEGGFWSALDAETDGREGAFYVWSREQLREVLDEEEMGFLGAAVRLRRAALLRGRVRAPPAAAAGGAGRAAAQGPRGAARRDRAAARRACSRRARGASGR